MMNITSTSLSFSNGRGQALSALLEMPEDAWAYGVFAPCFTCTKESHGAYKICRALANKGIAMLRFDMTGLGQSEGDFAQTNFTTRIADIVAAAGAQTETPVLLVGHSISGVACIAAALQLPSVKLVATVGSPADPRHVVEKLTELGRITITGDKAEMLIAGRTVVADKSFIDDARTNDMTERTAASGKLLIFHAPNDNIVGFGNAEKIQARAGKNAEIIPLGESTSHLLERGTEDANLIAAIIAEKLKLEIA